MEILSPAGNMEALTAAVRSGANAVYLGLKEFSARRNADNFSLEDLKTAVDYCHERNVKVYVAINTMIKEKELADAVNTVTRAYNCSADAFIVTDLGLISVLRTILPEAELHASTQMTVHSPAAIKPLKRLGISRVVLGREMSREEIREFCKAARKENIEVEVFVHGALCMCVSGQCLMSSALGGRSGNRGLCAGPCRLEFSSSGSGRYDLSLKDLSLIDYLRELENMGVASAKIEGRMKRPEYVAAATAACRASLEGRQDDELKAALKSVFSRSGFTDGYYKAALGKDMFGTRTRDDAEISKSAFSYLHSLYRNERSVVPIDISAYIKSGEQLSVTLIDERKNKISVSGDIPESAENRATTEDDIKTALSKLGGTPYFARKINVDIDDGLFVNISQLNRLRRSAVEKLGLCRREANRYKNAEYRTSARQERTRRTPEIYTEFLSASYIPEDLSGVCGVILPLDADFDKVPKTTKKIARLPRYIQNEEKVQNRLLLLKENRVFTALCDNLSAMKIAVDAGFKVICSNGLNCANSESVKALESLGACAVTLSAETYMPSAKSISADVPIGIFAFGRLPLMLTKNCPVKNTKTCAECKNKSSITDRQGVKFPVRCKNGAYSEIFNSSPIYLADKRDDLSYFDFIILSFLDESPKEAKRIIDDYIEARPPKAEFTRGLYYKNIP